MSREDGKYTAKITTVQCQTAPGGIHTDGAWYFVKGVGSEYIFAVCDEKEVAERVSHLLNTYGLVEPEFLAK